MTGRFLSKYTVILLPVLSCSVTNELTAHSHMRITMQNPALLIGRGTVACKKIPEDKRLRQLAKQSSMAHNDTGSQDTADGTPSTMRSNVTPPIKK